MLGDCLERMKEIKDGSVDMVMVDPPYGTTACKWDSVIPLERMWKQLKRVTKERAAILIMASQPFTSILLTSKLNWFRHDWIWYKNKPSGYFNAKFSPLRSHESVLVFAQQGRTTFNAVMEPRSKNSHTKGAQTGTYDSVYHGKEVASRAIGKDDLSRPKSIQQINCIHWTSEEKEKHPTQKPVALMEYLIKTYTNRNETVLDFAMGSGTTGVACKNLHRNFIGIELDPDYFKIAEERIQNAQTP